MVILPRHFGTLRTCVQIEVRHDFTHELRSLEGMDILVKSVTLCCWHRKEKVGQPTFGDMPLNAYG